ncbi:60S ribosomal protein L18a [Microtus ochrogaster]|uniref:60S ribosomal protein L18a n=1 Tax=Microtus ochrogaster TaxID=79684 RepID=A0A8J6KKH3_MICOH|nr:60S ribosomal protein L18a [Microtus ochrogaster]
MMMMTTTMMKDDREERRKEEGREVMSYNKHILKTASVICLTLLFTRSCKDCALAELWYLCYHDQHNVYHKYQDLSRVGAITQCCRDTGPRHCAGESSSIQTMKVEEVAVGKCRQKAVKFHDSKIKFPLPHLDYASPLRGPIPSSGTENETK